MNASSANARRPSITVKNAADIKSDTRRRDTNYVRFIIAVIAATLLSRSSPPNSAETTSATRKTRISSNVPNATTPSQPSRSWKSTKSTAPQPREPWSRCGRRQNARVGSWSKLAPKVTARKTSIQIRVKKKWSRTRVAKIATTSWWMSAMIGGVPTVDMDSAKIAMIIQLWTTFSDAPPKAQEPARAPIGTATRKENITKIDIASSVWSNLLTFNLNDSYIFFPCFIWGNKAPRQDAPARYRVSPKNYVHF